MLVYCVASTPEIARTLAASGLYFDTSASAQAELDYINGIGPDSGPTGLKVIALELDEYETRHGIVRRVSGAVGEVAAASIWMIAALSLPAIASLMGAA
jgi:hypothetical protein